MVVLAAVQRMKEICFLFRILKQHYSKLLDDIATVKKEINGKKM